MGTGEWIFIVSAVQFILLSPFSCRSGSALPAKVSGGGLARAGAGWRGLARAGAGWHVGFRQKNGDRRMDFYRLGCSAHSSVPILLSIRVGLAR